MKILLLSDSFYPKIGGIESHTFILANAFYKRGYDIRLVTWSTNAQIDTFPFVVIRNPSVFTLFIQYLWANIVFENNPSLKLSWPNIFFRHFIVVVLHTWINRVDGTVSWQDRLKKTWLKRADKVIACSNAIRNRCWPSSLVIQNPYQQHLFRIIPSISKVNDFVFLGRLVSDKGVDIAIRAFYALFNYSGTDMKTSFTIVGDGPERIKLENLVTELNLIDKVIFTGSLTGEPLVELLNRHRYILVPSQWEEPFGMVALEGMACGCIPIVSDGGGLPEAVGKAGMIFKRSDINSLIKCLQHIISDSSLETQLKSAAPDHLKNHYQDIIGDRYIAVLESVKFT